MKHRFENGKWMPENRTFVRVPNEQIPEVIQLLRDNGQPVRPKMFVWFCDSDGAVWFNHENEWNSLHEDSTHGTIELPFPDFKALVTGELPESWCIQCTEESVKHEAWPRFIEIINRAYLLSKDSLGWYAGDSLGWYYCGRPEILSDGSIGASAGMLSFGEVLQIETWAALNPVEETTEKPCTCKPVPADAFPDEPLIRVLKSRGYTVSKIY